MRVGLYLHRQRPGYGVTESSKRAWRVVSEDPFSGFLLIVRTGRIFTANANTRIAGVTPTSTAGYSDVPAYSQVF